MKTVELPREVRLARTLRNSLGIESQIACDVADELDAIGKYSTSYPFLALARKINAEYGDVLWFVDYLATQPSRFPMNDVRFTGAIERLSPEQRKEIKKRFDVLRRES